MKKVIGLLFAVVMAVVLFVPISDAVTQNTGATTVTNESVDGVTDTYQDLDGYDIETDSETVYWYNATSGSWETLTSGTDYEMNYSAGEINLLSSGDVSDGDDVQVSYTYEQTSGITTTIVGFVPLFMAVLIIGIMGQRISNKV